MVAVTLSTVMLAGCAASSGDAKTASGVKTKEASGKTTTITIWTDQAHNKEFMDKKVNEFNKTTGKKKGVAIDYQVKENIGDMLEVAFTSDQAPDMFPISDIEKYVTEGRVQAIEDMPGGKELVAKYDGKLANYKHSYGGKTYILPSGATTYGLVYNKDMFKAAGIVDEKGEAKAPETLKELRDDAKRLTNPDKNEYGIALPGKYSSWFGDDVLFPTTATDGTFGYNPVTGLYDYSGVAKVMKTLIGIKDDKSFLPGVEGLDNDPARARFAEGGIGMYFSASYDYGVFTDQFPAKCDWGVAPYPAADSANAHKQIVAYSRYLAIGKKAAKAKDPKKIMEVYKWLYSDEMAKESYQKGYAIPCSPEIVKDVKIDKDMKRWAEYANLLDVSIATPMQMPVDISGQREAAEIWLNDIWSGKVPAGKIDAKCEEMSKTLNDGIEKYKDLHPDFDPNGFIVSDWDTQSKR